jgi:8-oxo-dGTP diphosphatase
MASYGGVVIREDGRVLLREPTKHFGGYVWTLPKGGADPGESPEEAAVREVREETGVIAKVVGRVPGEFPGTTGVTVFFRMSFVEDTGAFDWETKSIVWADIEEARRLIQLTKTSTGRARDLAVLEAAFKL